MLEKAENMDDTTLPADFDGVFRFTNSSDEDFTTRWNNVEYTFPASKTSPMIIPNETQEGIQSIRKKFARDFAEREFYKTEKFSRMNGKEAGPRPALYTDSDLAPFIQKCLEPLEIVPAKVSAVKVDVEQVFKKDNKGQPRTKVLEEDTGSLVGDGTVVA